MKNNSKNKNMSKKTATTTAAARIKMKNCAKPDGDVAACRATPRVTAVPTCKDGKYRVVMRLGDLEYVDELNPYSASARDKYVRAGAQKLKWTGDEVVLADEVLAQTRRTEEQLAAVAVGVETPAAAKQRLLEGTPQEVIDAADRFLKSKDIVAAIIADFRELGVVGEEALCLASYLIATSRLLDKPLGGIVQAASSSGKSHVTNIAMDMVPPEEVLRATDISPQALYYLKPGSLEHKVVYVAERKHADVSRDAASANNTLAFRELMSNGKLMKFVTEAGDAGMVTRCVEQKGPIAYLETTTQEMVLEEDQNRLLQLQTDESPEQTARIIKHIASAAASSGGDDSRRASIIAKHHAAQRMLSSYRVVIPFAPMLTIPADKVSARRAYRQMLAMIEAAALLRQMQKKSREAGRIIATPADYAIAYEVMLPVLRRSLSVVSERALALYDTIETKLLEEGSVGYFTRKDCVDWTGLSLTEVRNRIKALEDLDLVRRKETVGTGSRALRYELEPKNRKAIKLSGLLAPKTLEAMLEAKKAGKLDAVPARRQSAAAPARRRTAADRS